MAKAYGPLPPFSPIPPENTTYLDSDVFANFTTWESSQSDLVSERGRLFSELMSSMRLLVEESGETTIDVTSELGVSLLQLASTSTYFLLSMRGPEGVEVMRSEIDRAGDDGGLTAGLVSFVIDFLEEFVELSAAMEERNKHLLGEVVNFVRQNSSSVPETTAFMDGLAARFDASFLSHVDLQASRLLKAPAATVETAKMLDLVRVVKVLCVEAVGRTFGEAAEVMGQLAQYEDDGMRGQVLKAGMEARDEKWREEFWAGLEEAVEGLQGEATTRKGDEDRVELKRRLETMLVLKDSI